jgi:Mo-dependent nitrogenase C-terminus
MKPDTQSLGITCYRIRNVQVIPFMSELNMSDLNLASPFKTSTTVPSAPSATFLDTLLKPVRTWLDGMEITDRDTAHLLCKLIPAQCPFERDVVILGRKVAHIPPMCKINPIYEQLVGLRFRSLCYLVDVCGESL